MRTERRFIFRGGFDFLFFFGWVRGPGPPLTRARQIVLSLVLSLVRVAITLLAAPPGRVVAARQAMPIDADRARVHELACATPPQFASMRKESERTVVLLFLGRIDARTRIAIDEAMESLIAQALGQGNPKP